MLFEEEDDELELLLSELEEELLDCPELPASFNGGCPGTGAAGGAPAGAVEALSPGYGHRLLAGPAGETPGAWSPDAGAAGTAVEGAGPLSSPGNGKRVAAGAVEGAAFGPAPEPPSAGAVAGQRGSRVRFPYASLTRPQRSAGAAVPTFAGDVCGQFGSSVRLP